MSLTFNGLNGLSFGDGTSQNTAASGFGFKNRIINGDMRIDQRNVGVIITPSQDSFLTDRWKWGQTQSSKFTAQQSGVAPSGFSNSLLLTVTSAHDVGISDYFTLYQPIEGYNVVDLGWGTSSAQTVCLSFRVRSSLTGTFGGAIRNSAGNRSYPFTYTISSANTWTIATVTIPGDTSGTWVTNSGVGMYVNFGLGVRPSLSGPSGSWASANYISASDTTSVAATLGATFYITGVQVEKSPTVTAYDYRPYNIEDVLCKRYFEKSYDFNTTIGSFSAGWRGTSTNGTVFAEGPGWPFSVVKRTIPTVVFYNAVSGASGRSYQVSTAASIAVSARYIGTTGIGIIDYTSSGGQNSYYIHYTADAEL